MVIGTRILTIRSPDGDIAVPVRLCAPEYDDGHWICRYTIGWPGQPRDSFGAGVDALQALHLTMQKIGIDLYVSEAHKAGILMWDKPGDGYGFPIPKNGRDFLIGWTRSSKGEAGDGVARSAGVDPRECLSTSDQGEPACRSTSTIPKPTR